MTTDTLALPLAGYLYFIFAVMLSVIDWRTLRLPDPLTLGLLWAGLLFHTTFSPAFLPAAIWGAVAGYLGLWLLNWAFWYCTHKDGIGYGDLKLSAAIGACNGLSSLPAILAVASLAGIMTFIVLRLTRGKSPRYLPFGPYLALTAWAEFMLQKT